MNKFAIGIVLLFATQVACRPGSNPEDAPEGDRKFELIPNHNGGTSIVMLPQDKPSRFENKLHISGTEEKKGTEGRKKTTHVGPGGEITVSDFTVKENDEVKHFHLSDDLSLILELPRLLIHISPKEEEQPQFRREDE